jgi:hypothetical protein
MGFLEGMSQSLSPPLNEFTCLRLLGGSMDLFQLTFLFGSILAFQKGCWHFDGFGAVCSLPWVSRSLSACPRSLGMS